MRLSLIVLLLLTPLSKGQQQMSHEEQIVRITYARLAFSAQINEVHALLKEHGVHKGLDRAEFQRRLQSTLQVELSDFKVGPLSEIAKVKYSDLVTKPSQASGSSLYVAPGRFNYSKDGQPTQSAIAVTHWIPSNDITENWDIPFADGYAQGQFAGQHQRYASFKVKATFEGRSREYRAVFLFGAGPNGTEVITPLDTIININGGAVSHFAAHDAYPESLVEGGLGNDPVIREWLNTNQVSHGHPGTANCDPATMHCGIHSDDLKTMTLKPISYRQRNNVQPHLVQAGFHPHVPVQPLLQAPTSCAGFNNVFGLNPDVSPDTTNHITGQHVMTTSRSTTCQYSQGNNSNGLCNTECDVNLVPVWSETGTVSSSCHATGVLVDAGFATGTGAGASCTGVAGGGVTACSLCQCNVSISIVGLTVSSSGFFTAKSTGNNTCAAQTQPTPTPTPTPTPPPPPPPPTGCTTPPGSHFRSDQTGDDTDPSNCSPIIIDLTGDGFFLTSAANGVKFDIANTGTPLQIAWTANGNNAFLVLDRNGNGVINSGAELFGNFTPQPASDHPNGFLALAQYDSNGDGVIDAQDPIYSRLRLWVDANHDGISQPGELHTLPEMGVFSISLNYSLSTRTDEFGNVFRYKAKINQGLNGNSDVGKKAYDVFFVNQ